MQVINANKRTMSSTWEKKVQEKERRQRLKEYENELLAGKKARADAEKEKKLQKKNRKAANEFKSKRMQVIKDTSKIKNMSKKQLRMIRKTAVDDAGNTITVPLYA
jgi:rRNA-processing protein CGR1